MPRGGSYGSELVGVGREGGRTEGRAYRWVRASNASQMKVNKSFLEEQAGRKSLEARMER